jgi:hypothetical protein
MPVRALQLQTKISEFTYDGFMSGEFSAYHLSGDERDHIRYLVVILLPYFFYTECLSRTTNVTFHKVWSVYTALFEYLEKIQGRLLQKRAAWKQCLADSAHAAHAKLTKY